MFTSLKTKLAFKALVIVTLCGFSQEQITPPADHTWVSGCDNGRMVFLALRSGVGAQNIHLYATKDCKGQSVALLSVSFDYTTHGNLFDSVYTEITMTANNELGVKALNRILAYNKADWKAGVKVDVSGIWSGQIGDLSLPLPKVGNEFHSIFEVDGENLYVGQIDALNNGSTADKRAKVLDENQAFLRSDVFMKRMTDDLMKAVDDFRKPHFLGQ